MFLNWADKKLGNATTNCRKKFLLVKKFIINLARVQIFLKLSKKGSSVNDLRSFSATIYLHQKSSPIPKQSQITSGAAVRNIISHESAASY